MALMFPPKVHRASSVAPVVMARRFRLQVRCNECRREAVMELELVDEPDERGSDDDLECSGLLNRIEPNCEHCGGGSVTILRTSYIRQPTDV